MTGAPAVGNFKHIIKSNQMSDCPVTLEDINGAENIHGKDISCIKRKNNKVESNNHGNHEHRNTKRIERAKHKHHITHGHHVH